MLEFRVVLEKENAGIYLREHGCNTDVSKMMVMCAFDGENIVAAGALSMDITAATLEEIAAEDETLMYAMGKAMLNTLDLGGVKKVLIKNEKLSELAKQLRFIKTDNGIWSLELEGYFTCGCSHGK